MKPPGRWMLLAGAGLVCSVFAFGGTACSDNGEKGEEPTATEAASAELPTVDITGRGDPGGDPYSFDAPTSIEGGTTQINFTNASQTEDHQAVLLRIDNGMSYDDFLAAAETVETESDVEALGATRVGGPAAFAGESSENVIDLDPGQYVLLCTFPDPNGVPHFALGMIQPLEVTEPTTEVEAPTPDVTVGESEFAFDAPDTLSAGEHTIEAVNNGAQPHEMALLRPGPGVTVDDLLSEEATPDIEVAGVISTQSGGQSAQTTVDLEPGTHILTCFVTDPETGQPHAALGMYKQIEVQ